MNQRAPLETYRLRFGIYRFAVRSHPANVAGLMQRDVFYQMADDDEMFVRSFFFDDITTDYIATFCEQFAINAAYRLQACQRRTAWAQCNDLFLRNSFNPYFQDNPVRQQLGSLVATYYFFRQHTARITALPRYRRIQNQDNAQQPDPHHPDPRIARLITALNRLDGVRTLASCQGVTATVHYANVDLLTVSPHARHAYIWFIALPDNILKYFLDNASIAYENAIYPTLQATGDNAAFLRDMWHMLQQIS